MKRFLEFLSAALCLGYSGLFIHSIWPYIFNPLYVTDDALQQSFPLWKAVYSDAFRGDPVTESMMGYLPPVHWWVSYIVTLFTQSPMMTGHIVMVIQLLGTLLFLYLLVAHLSARIPAIFAVGWYLHTRNLPMRMTSGLPRGWAGVILTAFLFYLCRRKHKHLLVVLFLGILLNPPAAFLCAATYGLMLLWESRRSSESYRDLKRFLLLCPLYIFVAWLSMHRPAHFGSMASLEQAEQNPAFDRVEGRFPFLPLRSPWDETRFIGIQAFLNGWEPMSKKVHSVVLGGCLLAVLGGYLLRFRKSEEPVEYIPKELLYYFVSIFIVYFASRFFAFYLYVPNRHLQFPLNTFWIAAFPVLLWRLTSSKQSYSFLAFLMFAGLIYGLGGSGLKGSANFNTRVDNYQRFYTWARLNTPRDAVFAGDPISLDELQLATVRIAYITQETAHPFYSGYWKLASSRLSTSFKLQYAANDQEFLENLGDEKIDYFVFARHRFRPERLAKASYYKPHKQLVRQLAKRAMNQSYFADLEIGIGHAAIAYQDDQVIVVDVNLLKELDS